MIDGKYAVVGAGSCAGAKASYLTRYNNRMTETGGVSAVDVTGSWNADETGGGWSVTVEQLDPGAFNAHQVTFFLYEDDITWCCGYGGVSHWDGVARVISTQTVSVDAVGESVTVDGTFPVGVDWNLDNMRAAAIFEEIGGQKTVVQAGDVPRVIDFVLASPGRIGSAPTGNSTVDFSFILENVSGAADTYDLSASDAGSWDLEFQVEGDANFYENLSIGLADGETRDVTVRATTDGVKEIRNGAFNVYSQTSERTAVASVRIFNLSHSIFFVDDDGTATQEAIIESSLNSLGYLFDDWNVGIDHANEEPILANMLGYDCVVYHTGQATNNLLDDAVEADLGAYLASGGTVFLNSMETLNANTPSSFWSDYMGVSSWVANTKAHTATGEAGDPISDGMVLSCTFASESFNRVDNLTPAAGAFVVLRSEIGGNPAMVRREIVGVPGARSAFSTIPLYALSTVDPDPNNAEHLLGKTLEWLLESDPTDVEPAVLAGLKSGLVGAWPNPFSPSTELRFAVSPKSAASDLSLIVVDAAGRQVRRLVEGSMEAGRHAVDWDGLDDSGRAIANGMYFARLRTADGESTTKMIRIR